MTVKSFAIAIAIFFSHLSIASIEDNFTIGEDKYSIKISSTEVTTATGQAQLIRYSVYENGQFVHSSSTGGRFFSCRKDKPAVKAIQSAQGNIGWMIVGYGICGNTLSNNIELVIPAKNLWGGKTLYLNKTFIAKETPHLIPTIEGAEVWFHQQNWGNGGTATSIFVPRKLLISKQTGNFSISKGDVFENISTLESMAKDSWLKPNFISLFVAGIEDANPPLMQYAIDKYYQKEMQTWYEVYVQDGSFTGVNSLVKQVEVIRSLYHDMKYTVSWDFDLTSAKQDK
ncbi:hypothetical protein [Pseudoalteromonas byunsanensis]|uniref:Uncharacterized protein n=1 Tax=Pseudoalteromonas byunsanensis TaxID=327939 RepID=A0A1S1N292_9GAMM|nr:hypothetical protein [Pseudoalteromonas byunsanensis]OHU93486.1 hypothetical protein BIW53_19210 [Pseudoalteromonas byunsanensis]